MDATTAGVLGAAIGASGAVVAQIVSASFTARRETKKHKADRLEAVNARFFPARLDTCSKFLEEIIYLQARMDGVQTGKEEQTELDTAWEERLPVIASHRTRLLILAPNVVRPVDDVLRYLERWHRQVTETDYDEWSIEGFRKVRRECERSMQWELGLPLRWESRLDEFSDDSSTGRIPGSTQPWS